jgi:hypothetical protein
MALKVLKRRHGLYIDPLCRLGAARLKDLGIIFKQTPYDVKAS